MDDAANYLALSLAWTPAAAVAALLVVLALGWARERHSRVHHRTMQRLYKLGEELTAGRSLTESLRLLQSVLPDLLGVTDVHVYVPDRTSKELQRLELNAHSGLSQTAVLAEETVGFLKQSAVLCFRNRSSIAVPDTRRSPLFDLSYSEQAPRSAMFLPMFAQEDLLGVLAISNAKRLWHFSAEDRAVAQHLANQLAIGMKLLEQKSLRERALGGERVSAVHRLVTTAVAQLRQPLAHITDLVQLIAGRHWGSACEPELAELSGEAGKAADLLSRILKLAAADTDEEGPANLGSALRTLMEARRSAWQQRHVRVQVLVDTSPLVAAARTSIVEQVLASLLWHVEQRLENFAGGTVTVRAFRLAAMAHAEVSWPPAGSSMEAADVLDNDENASGEVLGFRSCRDLILSQGGQLRLSEYPGGETRLELELPLARQEVTSAPRDPGKPTMPLTALVLEPEPADRHTLISALSDLGHRSVPASGCEEAVELARRMQFDVLFCSASLQGTPWPECYEGARNHVQAFVLLTRGHDPALAAALESGGPRTLAKPVRQEGLVRVLQAVGQRSIAPGR
jgi:signal transduction histidine kinase